jgi:hypothetical protein
MKRQLRPPCAFLAQIEGNVDISYTIPPKLGGKGTRVDIVFFNSSTITGGSTPPRPPVLRTIRNLLTAYSLREKLRVAK